MMDTFNPKVSIIIPVYNGSNYLKEAIDSALSQTYENIEVIVVNDGATDDGATEQIALSYGDKIRYYYKENGGVSSALNYGIKVMEGEYFSWLSHDDLYAQTKVADSIELLSEQQVKENTIVCCGSVLVDENARIIRKYKEVFLSKEVYCGDILYKKLIIGKTLNGCCLLIPKTVFDKVGLFDETLRYCQDALMWYKIFFAGYSLVYDEKENVKRRVHQAQASITSKDIFYKDSFYISKILIPLFIEKSNKDSDILFGYAENNAKLNCIDVVNACISAAKEKRLFSPFQIIKLKVLCYCGKYMRERIKKVYYKLLIK